MSLADAVPFAVAHWNLDEASGTRADSIGSNDLTDNNTVGSAAGMFGNAADFEASTSEYLDVSDNAALSMGDIDFCIRLWIKFETIGTAPHIFRKGATGVAALEYTLWYDDSASRLEFQVSDGSASSSVRWGSALSTATWYLVHCWHDSTANQIGIAVDAGTAVTQAHTTGVQDGAGTLTLGARTGTPDLFFDGLIDDLVILKNYILDATERTEDYNSGTGVAFADWDGGAAAGHPAVKRFGGVQFTHRIGGAQGRPAIQAW